MNEHTYGRMLQSGSIIRCDADNGNLGAIADSVEVAHRLAECWNAFDGIPTEQFEGKSVEEFVTTEAYLTGMQPSPHKSGFGIGLTGLAGQMLAASFAGQFIGTGATNFLEINMSHPAIGPFSVTMQKTSGLTPASMKAQAEKERDEAIRLLKRVRHFVASSHEPVGSELDEIDAVLDKFKGK